MVQERDAGPVWSLLHRTADPPLTLFWICVILWKGLPRPSRDVPACACASMYLCIDFCG